MTEHNANNERIKRKYFSYLKEAMRHSEPTVDASAKALDRVDQVLQGTTKAIDLPDQVLPGESRYPLLAMSKQLRQQCSGCWTSSDLMALMPVGLMSPGVNNPAARFTPRTSTPQA